MGGDPRRAAGGEAGAGANGPLLLAGIALLLVVAASTDMLYGITGAIFWYLVGRVAAAEGEPESPEAPAQGQEPATPIQSPGPTSSSRSGDAAAARLVGPGPSALPG